MFGTRIVECVQADRWRRPDLANMMPDSVRPVVFVNAFRADGLSVSLSC
jgi:hypothetical protein